MKNSECSIQKCQLFFWSLLTLIISGTLFLLMNGKSESFILLNQYHTFWLNVFFINYTFLGDGIFPICLILLCFFWKKKKLGATLLFAFLFSGIIAQIIKHIVSAPRPKLFFGNSEQWCFINGIHFSLSNSFPSGHTTTAFAIASVLVLMIKDKKFQLPVLLAAALVGFSRIYLGQHFLIDVLIGSIIGTLSGIACVYIVQRYDWFNLKQWQIFNYKRESSVPSPEPI